MRQVGGLGKFLDSFVGRPWYFSYGAVVGCQDRRFPDPKSERR